MKKLEHIENIVFCGGGSKGIFHIAGLQILNIENPGWMDKIKRCSGASIGALFAFFIACQTPFYSICQLILETTMNDIFGHCERLSFTEKKGLLNMKGIERWIENYLHDVMGLNRNATFHDLFLKTGVQLIVSVSNLTTHHILYFGSEGLEHEPIAQRIADSMALPFLFEKRIYKNEWVGDGGWFNNIPFEPFGLPNTMIFVFPITDGKGTEGSLKDTFIDLFYECNDFIHLDKLRKLSNEEFMNHIMLIPDQNLSVTNFKLNKYQKMELIQKTFEQLAFERNHLESLVQKCLMTLLEIN